MTYNFDPDKWYDNEMSYLNARYRNAEISRPELDEALAVLDEKLEAMWKRLDGSYQVFPETLIPSQDQKG